MKKGLYVAAVCSIALLGCSNTIAGKYYYQSYSGNLNTDTYFELKEDGTCVMKASGEESACTYGEGIITIGDESITYKITKNVLTVSFPGSGGEEMSFEKK